MRKLVSESAVEAREARRRALETEADVRKTREAYHAMREIRRTEQAHIRAKWHQKQNIVNREAVVQENSRPPVAVALVSLLFSPFLFTATLVGNFVTFFSHISLSSLPYSDTNTMLGSGLWSTRNRDTTLEDGVSVS